MCYSLPETAVLTGLSLSTIQRRLATGEIKSVKMGRRRLVPRGELERLCNTDPSRAPHERWRIGRRWKSVSRGSEYRWIAGTHAQNANTPQWMQGLLGAMTAVRGRAALCRRAAPPAPYHTSHGMSGATPIHQSGVLGQMLGTGGSAQANMQMLSVLRALQQNPQLAQQIGS